MPVHFTGNVCDMDAVGEIADRHALPIIEDAAPAFGASYGSRRAGTFGVLGCFSMNPMKVLGAVGEAGLVVAHTVEHAERLRELRYHGIRNKDVCLDVSLNARLDTLQAAMLSIRVKSLERNLARTAGNRGQIRLASIQYRRSAETGRGRPPRLVSLHDLVR